MSAQATNRSTGTWTDRLRTAWRRGVGTRFPGLDRASHRLYFNLERVALAFRLIAGPHSLVDYLRLETRWAPDVPVRVRVRPLGGREVWLRPDTTDAVTLRDTFRDGVNVPAELASRSVRWALDLGANIGITVLQTAFLHPEAHVVAVELDPDNAELARRNCADLGDRVTILQGAVWTEDGEVAYERERGNEYGFRVVQGSSGPRTGALSTATIVSHVPPEERIDYVKMDIEGVEASLLAGEAAGWTERVDLIGLQVHDPYTLADCARDLAALGFRPRVEPRRTNYIVGAR
jgi:FkbM family methyltransferase